MRLLLLKATPTTPLLLASKISLRVNLTSYRLSSTRPTIQKQQDEIPSNLKFTDEGCHLLIYKRDFEKIKKTKKRYRMASLMLILGFTYFGVDHYCWSNKLQNPIFEVIADIIEFFLKKPQKEVEKDTESDTYYDETIFEKLGDRTESYFSIKEGKPKDIFSSILAGLLIVVPWLCAYGFEKVYVAKMVRQIYLTNVPKVALQESGRVRSKFISTIIEHEGGFLNKQQALKFSCKDLKVDIMHDKQNQEICWLNSPNPNSKIPFKFKLDNLKDPDTYFDRKTMIRFHNVEYKDTD